MTVRIDEPRIPEEDPAIETTGDYQVRITRRGFMNLSRLRRGLLILSAQDIFNSSLDPFCHFGYGCS